MTPEISSAFDAIPRPARDVLLSVRDRLFAVAEDADVGPLTETLKWGQPSYLTEVTRAGTTVRLGLTNGTPAVFFTCHTNLVDGFRSDFPKAFTFLGNRGLLLQEGFDVDALDQCLARALTYQRTRRKAKA